MAQDINEPIDITVDKRVRAVMRSRYAKEAFDKPFEVADIQHVIKAMSIYINVLRHRVLDVDMKCKRQKHQITELTRTIMEQKETIKLLKGKESI